tara:strand:+ start:10 stop:1668 length:1659 start_codon:yes stop_codon:yes gene_type:complete
MDFTHAVFMRKHQTQTTDESAHPSQAMVAMMSEVIAHEPHWFTTPEVVDFMDEIRPLLLTAVMQRDTHSVVRQARKLLSEFRARWPEDDYDGDTDYNGGAEGEGHEDVRKGAVGQKKAGSRGEKVSRNRFKDMKKADQSKITKPSECSECGEGEGSPDGSDGDGSDSDEGEGSDGSGDAEGDGSGDGDDDGGDGDGDSENDGSGKDSDRPSDRGDDTEEDGKFEESWSTLREVAESEMAMDEQHAKDLESTHESEVERATASVDESREGLEHQIEVTAAARDIASRELHEIDLWDIHYDDVVRENRGGILNITNEIKRRIKGSNPTWSRGHRSGRVDPRQTWKLTKTSPMKADRIFMKKTERSDPTANVMILIDASGSMGAYVGDSNRAQYASDAAVVMSEVMNTLNFNYEIVDFNTQSGTTMRVRKSFRGSLSSIEKAAIAAPFVGSNNSDGYAVEWCLNRLNKMRGNRFLIVISDGQPAGSAPYGLTSEQHLIQVVNDAPENIGLVSIGIAGMDTSEFYPNAVKVEDTTQLASEMIPVLREVLRSVVPKK